MTSSGQLGVNADPSKGRRDAPPQNDRRPNLADYMVPVIIFVFCIIVAALTTTFDKAPDLFVGMGMQPRNFPLFLVFLMAALNVALAVRTFKNTTPPQARPALEIQTWVTIALMGMFALVTSYADMMLAIALMVFSMCLLWGERRLWAALLLAISTPLTIFLFFDIVLEVRFPRGWITNIYYG